MNKFKRMNAVLLIIGDEILSGTTIDTNSSFISQELRNIGIHVEEILSVSDDVMKIENGLAKAFQVSNLVLATGGLGPTRDDKTKKAFATYFKDEIVFDEQVFAHLKTYLEKRNRVEILDKNRSQAEVFKTGGVILNEYGTAPCLYKQVGEKLAFCLPGVPTEVKPLIKDKILPFLKNHYKKESILVHTVSVINIPESLLAPLIQDWELALPENFALSYLPVGTRIKLKITASGKNQVVLQQQMDKEIGKLLPLLGEYLLSTEGDKIEEILKSILLHKGLSISCAESCTGGGISRLITSVPGSSQYFAGGICTYQTSKKTTVLGVPPTIVKKHTVVSAEVAESMSKHCQQLFNTDIAIATTGVAGPASDAYQNQIGLAFYSIRIGEYEKTFKIFLPYFEREDFMDFLAQKTLQAVIEMLQNNNQNHKNNQNQKQ